MFAVTQGGGLCMAPGDVCLVPPLAIPVPFVNVAVPPLGVGFVPNIFIVTGMAHNQGTIIASSTGDEPGAMGGVSSGTIVGPAQYVLCSMTHLTGGMPTPRMTSTTLQNTGNVAGIMIAPSQTKVLVLAP